MHLPHPVRDHPAAARSAREAFWVLSLGVIAAYVFFIALGAFDPTDVVGVTTGVGVLAALWVVHAWTQGRHRREETPDPRLAHARERRGF